MEKNIFSGCSTTTIQPDGKRVASVVRENNLWTVAVDAVAWNVGFERVWTPQFSLMVLMLLR